MGSVKSLGTSLRNWNGTQFLSSGYPSSLTFLEFLQSPRPLHTQYLQDLTCVAPDQFDDTTPFTSPFSALLWA